MLDPGHVACAPATLHTALFQDPHHYGTPSPAILGLYRMCDMRPRAAKTCAMDPRAGTCAGHTLDPACRDSWVHATCGPPQVFSCKCLGKDNQGGHKGVLATWLESYNVCSKWSFPAWGDRWLQDGSPGLQQSPIIDSLSSAMKGERLSMISRQLLKQQLPSRGGRGWELLSSSLPRFPCSATDRAPILPRALSVSARKNSLTLNLTAPPSPILCLPAPLSLGACSYLESPGESLDLFKQSSQQGLYRAPWQHVTEQAIRKSTTLPLSFLKGRRGTAEDCGILGVPGTLLCYMKLKRCYTWH